MPSADFFADPPPCPCCVRIRYGWATKGWPRFGPRPVLAARHGAGRGEPCAPWVVHEYRMRILDHPDEGWVFVAEPYELTAVAAADLDFLRDAGFTVTVSGEAARHDPGRTVAVLITLPAPPPAGEGGL